MAAAIPRAISRYYCPTLPGVRVYPYDGIMVQGAVVAPEPGVGSGKKGKDILLTSLNGRQKFQDEKYAYCFVHKKWHLTTRITQHELALLYADLPGVRFALSNGRIKGKTKLANLIERRMVKARRLRQTARG